MILLRKARHTCLWRACVLPWQSIHAELLQKISDMNRPPKKTTPTFLQSSWIVEICTRNEFEDFLGTSFFCLFMLDFFCNTMRADSCRMRVVPGSRGILGIVGCDRKAHPMPRLLQQLVGHTIPITCTIRFGSTAKVLAKCKLKYYRISE